ncbi:uncharacterized protein STAUR_8122 [Stigmatella aurantiaca DW4/3-1]|nr:uncharacterized protein STAUR_8122 [Stigmatella aurantiaca DW4/3-1]
MSGFGRPSSLHVSEKGSGSCREGSCRLGGEGASGSSAAREDPRSSCETHRSRSATTPWDAMGGRARFRPESCSATVTPPRRFQERQCRGPVLSGRRAKAGPARKGWFGNVKAAWAWGRSTGILCFRYKRRGRRRGGHGAAHPCPRPEHFNAMHSAADAGGCSTVATLSGPACRRGRHEQDRRAVRAHSQVPSVSRPIAPAGRPAGLGVR